MTYDVNITYYVLYIGLKIEHPMKYGVFFNLFSYVLKPKHSLDNICMSVSEFVINHKIKR